MQSKNAINRLENQSFDLIPASKVRQSLGNVSDMTLWRWIHDPAYSHLKFPPPIVISKRRYWKQSEITAWCGRQETAKEAQ